MSKSNWEAFLDANYCSADPITENRPCDNGVYCDRCFTPSAHQAFENFKRIIKLVAEDRCYAE